MNIPKLPTASDEPEEEIDEYVYQDSESNFTPKLEPEPEPELNSDIEVIRQNNLAMLVINTLSSVSDDIMDTGQIFKRYQIEEILGRHLEAIEFRTISFIIAQYTSQVMSPIIAAVAREIDRGIVKAKEDNEKA